MSDKMPTAKELKAMATACRKAGILSFKGFGVEFTLAPESTLKPVKRQKKKVEESAGIQIQGPNGPITVPRPKLDAKGEIETDSLTESELLFWSCGDEVEGSST